MLHTYPHMQGNKIGTPVNHVYIHLVSYKNCFNHLNVINIYIKVDSNLSKCVCVDPWAYIMHVNHDSAYKYGLAILVDVTN